jgi:hypothetical protein
LPIDQGQGSELASGTGRPLHSDAAHVLAEDHDIMTSPGAVDVALGALRPGGRFVAAGVKLARGLRGALLNPLTLAVSLPVITHVAGLDRPWALLEARLGALEVEEHLWAPPTSHAGSRRPAPRER